MVSLNWKKYFNKKQQIFLFILLIIGVGLRVINAYKTQLWQDETFIFFTSGGNKLGDLLLENHWDTCHPPLYFVFLHFWQRLNISPFFLRLPSIIFSAGTLYLIPILAKVIYPGSFIFVLTTLFFFSFSHSQISLQMVARPYPFAIFFMVISMIFFLSLVKQRSRKRDYLIFSITNFFMFFFDYSSIWLIGTYCLFSLVYFILKRKEKEEIKKILYMIILSIYPVILWLPIFLLRLPQCMSLEENAFGWAFKQPNPFSILWLWQLPFFSSITTRDIIFKIWSINPDRLSLIIFMFSILGSLLLIKKNLFSGIFIVSAFFQIIIAFTISVFLIPVYVPRHLLIANIAALIGLSFLISSFFSKKKIIYFLILIIWIINFFSAFPYLHYTGYIYDWEGLVKKISKENIKKKTIFVTTEPKYIFRVFDYYNFYINRAIRKEYELLSVDEFDRSIINQGDNLFFVVSLDNDEQTVEKNKQKIEKTIKKINCKPEKVHLANDTDLFVQKCNITSIKK